MLDNFIMENPGVTQVFLGMLVGAVIYLYKKNEVQSVKLIAEKIAELCRAIQSLIDKDDNKERWMTRMQATLDARDARCEERAKMISAIMKRQDTSSAKYDSALINKHPQAVPHCDREGAG